MTVTPCEWDDLERIASTPDEVMVCLAALTQYIAPTEGLDIAPWAGSQLGDWGGAAECGCYSEMRADTIGHWACPGHADTFRGLVNDRLAIETAMLRAEVLGEPWLIPEVDARVFPPWLVAGVVRALVALVA